MYTRRREWKQTAFSGRTGAQETISEQHNDQFSDIRVQKTNFHGDVNPLGVLHRASVQTKPDQVPRLQGIENMLTGFPGCWTKEGEEYIPAK